MRRITLWLLSTLSALVLLLSYSTSGGRAASHIEAPATAGASTDLASATDTTGGGGAQATGSSSSSSSGSTSASASGTYTGDTVSTQWGPVQVRITVADGKITAAEAVQVPSGNPHDEQINSYAVPIYNAAAVTAQSAHIDAVSGATITWGGYTQSLQSAIDQAGIS